jgi:hypothetical protein
MKIQYLEIVTPDVEAVCATYAAAHRVSFSDPTPALGNARTAKLADGGLLGIRAPMHEAEKTVVRPYVLVDDIEAAVAAADKAGKFDSSNLDVAELPSKPISNGQSFVDLKIETKVITLIGCSFTD